MRLLVTRPEPDAALFKTRLEAMGHHVSLAPMIRIELDSRAIPLEGVQALIATSRNALRALAGCPSFGAAVALPIFTVGPGTLEYAHQLGFVRVHAGPGTARELAGLIASQTKPNDGPLVHLAGDRRAFDLNGALEKMGFRVRLEIVYHSVAAEALEPGIADAIRGGRLDGVIVMSPRSADVYKTLVEQAGLGQAASQLHCFCLSAGVAKRLGTLAQNNVSVAAAPNSEEMLALVARVASNSG